MYVKNSIFFIFYFDAFPNYDEKMSASTTVN